MAGWMSGYVANVEYTHGFYRELTPALLKFTTLVNRIRTSNEHSRLNYCELGCGQGFTINLLAAANPDIQFFANDFNPGQIAGARLLADQAGLDNIKFFDSSFEDFLHEKTIPEQFDIIVLHGIYSWVDDVNQGYIGEFIKKKLKVGGIVYASYNVMPGWAPLLPLRRILSDQYESSKGTPEENLDQAISFARRLKAVGSDYFEANPLISKKLDSIEESSVNYVVHEYFNKVWNTFFFEDIADKLKNSKMTFVSSVDLLETIDALNFSRDQQNLINSFGDRVKKESIKDVILNRAFRKDIYVKGPLTYDLDSWQSAWLDTRFTLIVAPDNAPLTIKRRLGEATLAADTYPLLIEILAQGPIELRKMIEDKRVAQLGWSNLTQAMTVLVGLGYAQPCLPAKDEKKRTDRVRAFNIAVTNRALFSEDMKALAAATTGGGIGMDRINQILLAAVFRKEHDPVAFAWSALEKLGHRVTVEDRTLETPEENLRELSSRHQIFSDVILPKMRLLGIV